MERAQALTLVHKFVKNKNLINHMLAVETAMSFYSHLLDQSESNLWRLAGLLHDFDWEIHPTIEQHPAAGEIILIESSVPQPVIRAIQSHADHTGIPRITLMEKALYACDEVTGLITAVALVRPSRSLYDLTSSSVKKKWKDRAFAAGANRIEISKGAEDFRIDLWDHVDNVILAMRDIAPEIDLAGNLNREQEIPITPVKPIMGE